MSRLNHSTPTKACLGFKEMWKKPLKNATFERALRENSYSSPVVHLPLQALYFPALRQFVIEAKPPIRTFAMVVTISMAFLLGSR